MAPERSIWKLSAIIEATEEEAERAADAVAAALCPDEEHEGYCDVPWTLMRCRFEDLEPEERAEWESDFDEQREHARDVDVPGA